MIAQSAMVFTFDMFIQIADSLVQNTRFMKKIKKNKNHGKIDTHGSWRNHNTDLASKHKTVEYASISYFQMPNERIPSFTSIYHYKSDARTVFPFPLRTM